jgi:large subunit ribosomal protein L30
MAEKKLRIRQVRSSVNRHRSQRRTLEALGLRGIRKTVVHPDRPEIRGMISKVTHLVEVEEVEA